MPEQSKSQARRLAVQQDVPAPDPNAPGTLVNSTKPERYGSPFYASNVMVVRCKECSPRSTAILIPVVDVRLHDEAHDQDDAIEAGG